MLPAHAGMIPLGKKRIKTTPVLPAHAGMILSPGTAAKPHLSAPRTCGDDPIGSDSGLSGSTCSPHMRG